MPKSKKPPKAWTVMVYMVAGNDAELDRVAVEDIREMERGVGLNAEDDVHVVVQINRQWPDSAQRYEIRKKSDDPLEKDFHRGGSTLVGPNLSGETVMSDRKTLSAFLTFALKNYPAEHYFLVLWGHAYGLGFGRDHNQKLRLNDLEYALGQFNEKRAGPGGRAQPIELLGTNACAMSYAEAIFQLRESAKLMVASQIAVPFAGWPYESILRRIEKRTTPSQLGELVVGTYVSHFNAIPGGERVTMTLLNLAQAQGLQPLVDDLAVKIDEATSPGGQFNSDSLAHVRDVFIGTAVGDVRPLIDLKELCTVLAETDASDDLRQINEKVDEFLEVNPHGLVVKHESHPALRDALNGVGIYAPFVTDEKDLRRLELTGDNDNALRKGERSGQDEYRELALFHASKGSRRSWPRLVYDGLQREIPPDLMTRILDIGVMNRGERADIAQIIMAIDSSFNILDRMIASASEAVVGELKTLGRESGARKPDPGAEEKPAKRFALPWLQLATPNSIARDGTTARVTYQSPAFAMSTSVVDAPGAHDFAPMVAVARADRQSVTRVVEQFEKLESIAKRVERATRRGLTHASFGIGPSGLDQVGFFTEGPKDGQGAPRRGTLDEKPKDGQGPPSNGTSAATIVGGDLRGDLALARVQELFSQVGQSLQALEQALAQIELTASATLTDSTPADGVSNKDYFEAAEKQMLRAFRVLEDSSATARRTVRRVLSHPVYGLGPGPRSLRLDEREELARSGGLDERNLQLL